MAANWTKSTEPTVVTDELLTECALKTYCATPEAIRLVKEDGLEFPKVEVLNLEFKGILKITNLWEFTSLRKLHLSCNVIETISGLETLVNLVYLDLSYNHIETISGLEKLVNLTDLSLTNNKIRKVENLRTLKKLQILSLKNNEIEDFNSVKYLYPYEYLRAATFSGNPIAEDEDYKLKALAYMPHLSYLDYRLVSPEEQEEAREKYKHDIEKLEEEAQELMKEDPENKSQEEEALHTDGFLLSLNGEELFDNMLSSDKKTKMLYTFPGASEVFNEYYNSFAAVMTDWRQQGLKEYRQRMLEVSEFKSCVDGLVARTLQEARSKVFQFSERKQQIFFEIMQIEREENSEQIIKDLIATLFTEIEVLWRTVMTLEMEMDEKLNKVYGEFEKNLENLLEDLAPSIRKYLNQLQDVDDAYVERIVKYYADWCRKSKEEKQQYISERESESEEFDPELINLLGQNSTHIEALFNDSSSEHAMVITLKETSLRECLSVWMARTLNEYQEEKLERHRQRIIEIMLYCDTAKQEVKGMAEYCDLTESVCDSS